jgi:glycosyltransferase involved in cell wall biosynthesis
MSGELALRAPATAATGQLRTIVTVRSCDSGIQGPENLILALAAALAEHGVRYVIVNLWDGTPPQVELHEEALRRGLESHIVASASSFDPAVLPRLAVTLRRLQPDVIHTHDIKSELATLVANLPLRRPVVTSYYGRLAINSLFLKLEDWARLLTFHRFAYVFANSSPLRDELLRWLVPANRCSLLPSFVDAGRITPATPAEAAAARARLGIAPGRPVLATVARISVNKGHRYMIEALAAVREGAPDVLYLVPGEGDMAWHGDGGLRGELERLAASLGLADHVRFLGYYPDLRTILDAADLIVSPSLREGMQVSLIEAMAAGKPIVATAVGGTPDAVVDGETGLLVPPADARALAEAVSAALADPRRLRLMGEAGRRRAEERFDSRVVAGQLLAACSRAVARG